MSWQGCEVVAFSRATQKELARFGRCGEGPGEFRNPGAIAFRGDTVVIADRRGRRLQFLSLLGVPYSQVALDTLMMLGANHIQALHWWRDSILITTNYLQSHQYRDGKIVPRHASQPYVRALNARNFTRVLFGAIVEGTAVSESTYGEQREMAACVVAGKSHSDARLVAINQWTPQLAVLALDSMARGSDAVQVNRRLPQFPLTVMQSNIRLGSMIGLAFHGACSDSVAIFSYREYTDTTSNFAQSARLVAITPSNAHHYVMRTMGGDEAALGHLVAAHRDAIFFSHNSRYGYPLIVEMRLRLLANSRH